MNEAILEDKPVEEGANDFNLEMEELKDFGKEEITVEDTTEPTTEEVSTPTETKEEDFTPLLDKLSKNIKYMDQEVKVSSLDDVITNYQKGLNHDRLEEKLHNLENSKELNYIRTKAKEAGMTPEQYIDAVEKYEKQQEEEKYTQQYDELIEKGISEDLAKQIVENNKIATEYRQDKVRRQEEEQKKQAKEKEDAENIAFVNEFPDVDIKTIPSEVFEDSKKLGLIGAYTKYLNKKLTTELNTLKQTNANKEKAPVKGVTEHGGVVMETDDFLKGLGF